MIMRLRTILFAFVLSLAALSAAHAAPVSLERARALALGSMRGSAVQAPGTGGRDGGGQALVLAKEAVADVAGHGRATLYYVFNKGSDGGMVVIAGDDRMRPVLGRTDSGTFSEPQANPGLRWWLDAVGRAAVAVIASDGGETYAAAPSGRAAGAVAPLVATRWGQREPYNMLCPYDSSHFGRSLTGCVATAMAQLMYYWRYPEHGSGTADYTTDTHGFGINENLAAYGFDYDKMSLTYTGTEPAEAQEAVARLMYACGVAAGMDYCALESGAVTPVSVLIDNFGMDESCNQIYRTNFTTAEWETVIRHELDQGRPLLYSGGSPSGRHIFICDGYDETGLFHINWGWNGDDDGYFDLVTLDPYDEPGAGFSSEQEIVYGIKPAGAPGDVAYDNRMYYRSVENMTEGTVPPGDTIRYKVYELLCRSKHFKGYVGTALYAADGSMADAAYCYTIDIDRNLYYGEVEMEYAFAADVPDGTYTLVPLCGESEDEYHAMTPVKGKGLVDHLVVTVSGGVAAVSQPAAPVRSLSIGGEPRIEGGAAYAGYSAGVTIPVKNTGAYFNDLLTVVDVSSGRTVFEDDFIIDEGETGDFVMTLDFDRAAAGTEYEVGFTDADGSRNVVGCFAVSVAEPAAGEPDMQGEPVTMDGKVVAYGDKLYVEAAYANRGGFYDGYSCLRVDVAGGHYYVNLSPMRLNKDERRVVESEVDVRLVLDELGLAEAQGVVRPCFIDFTDMMYVSFDLPVSFAVTADGTEPPLLLSAGGAADVADGTAYAGSEAEVKFTVANDGIAFSGVVNVTDAGGGESVYRGMIDVPEGGEADVVMDVTLPAEPGTHLYEVSVNNLLDEWQPIGSVSVDVVRTPAGISVPGAGGADGGAQALPVYTVGGVRVGTTADADRLPPGVYVAGGKKFVVK